MVSCRERVQPTQTRLNVLRIMKINGDFEYHMLTLRDITGTMCSVYWKPSDKEDQVEEGNVVGRNAGYGAHGRRSCFRAGCR